MYLRRQEGRIGDRGERRADRPGDRALRARRAQAPDLVEARWKLVRALYFKGGYTGPRRRVAQGRLPEGAPRVRGRDRHSRQEPRAEGHQGLPRPRARGPRRQASGPLRRRAHLLLGGGRLGRVGALDGQARGRQDRRGRQDPRLRADGDRDRSRSSRRAAATGCSGASTTRRPGSRSSRAGSRATRRSAYLRLAIGVNSRNFVNRHFLAEALARGGDAKEKAEAIALEEGIRRRLAVAAAPGRGPQDPGEARAETSRPGRKRA